MPDLAPDRRVPRTPPGHGCSSTPCTSSRTSADRRRRARVRRPAHVALQVVRTARGRPVARRRICASRSGPTRSGRRRTRAPERWETGTPSFEAIAGIRAAAAFLLDDRVARDRPSRVHLFAPLLEGLLDMDHVIVHGPRDLQARTPTVCFSVTRPASRRRRRARSRDRRVAVWSGNYYAVETMAALGLAEPGSAPRRRLLLHARPRTSIACWLRSPSSAPDRIRGPVGRGAVRPTAIRID